MTRTLLPLLLLLLFTACVRNNPVFRRIAKQSDDRIAKRTEENLKKSPALQEIDRLCTQQIPIFDGFQLVRRMSWQSDDPFLSYSYKSSADIQSVRAFYKNYFSQNRWELMRDQVGGWGPPWQATWCNKEYSISIEKLTGGESDYNLFCKKLLYSDKAL